MRANSGDPLGRKTGKAIMMRSVYQVLLKDPMGTEAVGCSFTSSSEAGVYVYFDRVW